MNSSADTNVDMRLRKRGRCALGLFLFTVHHLPRTRTKNLPAPSWNYLSDLINARAAEISINIVNHIVLNVRQRVMSFVLRAALKRREVRIDHLLNLHTSKFRKMMTTEYLFWEGFIKHGYCLDTSITSAFMVNGLDCQL